MKRNLLLLTLGLLCALASKATTYTFTHPCAMYTQADFDRVKTMLSKGTAPQMVKAAYDSLSTNNLTNLTRADAPETTLIRGAKQGQTENFMHAARDAAGAYQLALMWKLTDNSKYADRAITILKDWATKCTALDGDNNKYLCAGAQGYTFACAGEILLGYSGWADADKTTFKTWMLNIFATANKEFLDNHCNTTCGKKHYWSNWDLVNLASYMAIGILTENSEMVDYVVDYFTNTNSANYGNGNIYNLCLAEQTIEGEQMMQNQESGRDQGHAEMSAMAAANLAQIAYSLYTYNNSVSALNFWEANNRALLKMEEYVALSNLRNGTDRNNADGSFVESTMPFTSVGPWCNGIDVGIKHEANITHTALSDDSRGKVRPGLELVLNYYKNIAGLTSGYTYINQMATKMRPELGSGKYGTWRYTDNSGGYDQLGWSTLMAYHEDVTYETGNTVRPFKEVCYRTNDGNTAWQYANDASVSGNTQDEGNYQAGIFDVMAFHIDNFQSRAALSLTVIKSSNTNTDLAVWKGNGGC